MNTFPLHNKSRAPRRQAGVFLVELSFTLMIFLIMVFTIIEVSRALYLWNTLQEVTRRAARAAAVTNFKDEIAMNQLKREAIFDSQSGKLAFGKPITSKNITIDYIALKDEPGGGLTQVPIPAGSLPGCPVRNRVLCTADAGNASCIRFVRARICQEDTNCTQVPYPSLIPALSLPMNLPFSTTLVKAQSMGYVPGMAICG